MRKALYCSLAIALIVSFTSCKKNQFNDLKYGNISSFDWLQAHVLKGEEKKKVAWFQVFDWKENTSIVDGYKGAKEKFEKYPAKIFEDKWIWVLINNRIEIRLLAEDKVQDFQNTGTLKEFLKLFDLKGLEGISGPKLDGSALRKYIPKLPKK